MFARKPVFIIGFGPTGAGKTTIRDKLYNSIQPNPADRNLHRLEIDELVENDLNYQRNSQLITSKIKVKYAHLCNNIDDTALFKLINDPEYKLASQKLEQLYFTCRGAILETNSPQETQCGTISPMYSAQLNKTILSSIKNRYDCYFEVTGFITEPGTKYKWLIDMITLNAPEYDIYLFGILTPLNNENMNLLLKRNINRFLCSLDRAPRLPDIHNFDELEPDNYLDHFKYKCERINKNIFSTLLNIQDKNKYSRIKGVQLIIFNSDIQYNLKPYAITDTVINDLITLTYTPKLSADNRRIIIIEDTPMNHFNEFWLRLQLMQFDMDYFMRYGNWIMVIVIIGIITGFGLKKLSRKNNKMVKPTKA